MPGGPLFDRIEENGSYDENEASCIIEQILHAVNFMHQQQIVHRDLKPENILFFNSGDNSAVSVSDFGLSKMEEDCRILSKPCGTPGYIAPEIIALQPHGKPVDLWSIGVISYYLLCGHLPFDAEDVDDLLVKNAVGEYEFDSPDWDDISEAAMDFIQHLLCVDPTERMTCEEALSHPWITDSESDSTKSDDSGENGSSSSNGSVNNDGSDESNRDLKAVNNLCKVQ
ncbi:calcium/calmodulin-dependent protein kinase type 1-like isoform X2 [Paramacrobiotus metropolitanus]|uniref:calcium/calmodulin-dependent protein kinase type 1-like isoform X2 n=1 Tax=Paramacrobiotus metropolitanus TaxID=2943436 RepID=UPI00244610D8|nr:calcium/calmodulin-dependent protein kinase type 1-like isoform X2 [Paramacrobiotus metropolitanus]